MRALRKQVDLLGGELDLTVRMPSGEMVRLDHLSLEAANQMRDRGLSR